jgi:hypothetical protein
MATKTHLKGITTPLPDEVPALVNRQAYLDAEISKMETELEVIKYKLTLYALAQPKAERLKDDDNRDGRRVRIPGTQGHTCHVTIKSDNLIASFKQGSPKHSELLEILKGKNGVAPSQLLMHFFNPPATWENRHKDGKAFRQTAAEVLEEKQAAAFVAACRQVDKHKVPKNSISVVIKADGEEETKS